MNSNDNIVATFTDRFGEERKIHNTRHGLKLKRREKSNNELLSKAIGGYIGQRVKEIRLSKRMTMDELGERAALTTGNNLKQRVYEIENNLRGIGIKFGTAYQLAMALGVSIQDILPPVEWVTQETNISIKPSEKLSQ